MSILIAVVAITLLVSAACSLLESTLYSTRVAVLEASRSHPRHGRAAAAFLKLKRDITIPTSAILILNTIANTAGATLAGMYAAEALGQDLMPVFSGAFTLAILLIAEILPKTIGATSWKLLWAYLVWPISGLVVALGPLVWLTGKFAGLFSGSPGIPTVTEDEIRASIQMGAKSGELSSSELKMLESVFHFEDTSCQQVMIPRDEVDFIDLEQPAAELAQVWGRTRRSRYPVCRGSLDDIVGMVHAKDLVGVVLDDNLELESRLMPLSHVPETISISALLTEMQRTRRHMAAVIDEYGTVTGVITLSDVLEEIVGSIGDEHAEASREVTSTAAGKYTVRGNVPLARLNRELDTDLYDADAVTLSGLMVSKLGRLLRVGDTVDLPGAVAEVKEVRRGRASRIQLTMAAPTEEPQDGDETGEPTAS